MDRQKNIGKINVMCGTHSNNRLKLSFWRDDVVRRCVSAPGSASHVTLYGASRHQTAPDRVWMKLESRVVCCSLDDRTHHSWRRCRHRINRHSRHHGV